MGIRKMKLTWLAAAALGLAATASTSSLAAEAAKPVAPVAEAPWPEAQFEIFKLAPGKQEAFIRRIARNDEVARAGGQPPTMVYIHEDGADWDVLLLKPFRDKKPTPEQQAAMAAKRKELGVESGPAYFVAIRELIAAHTDTHAYGPITAGQWLAKLETWRAEHPAAH
jgi:hypothetical protein